MNKPDVQGAVPRPPFWVRLSVTMGGVVQIAGLVVGGLIMYAAAHLVDAGTLIRVILMIIGWFIIYSCCHAIAHYIVGRLLGIHFRGYGIRGTDHPENYPPGVRQAMSALPMFTVMTEKDSMKKASPVARALMFSAGETSSTVFAIVSAWYAWHSGTPGGGILLVVAIVMSIGATISTTIFPKGDYAKAIKALRGNA